MNKTPSFLEETITSNNEVFKDSELDMPVRIRKLGNPTCKTTESNVTVLQTAGSSILTLVTPLVLQVYFRDHKGSLDNPNMDTQSEPMKYHSDFLIGSTFRICSPIVNISITLPEYQ